MIGTFEVTAKKGNKRIVKYYTVVLKDTITKTLYDLCERLGYHDITIHLMA